MKDMIWNYLTFLFLVAVFIPSYNIVKKRFKEDKPLKIISYIKLKPLKK